jgi:hypothetical protein
MSQPSQRPNVMNLNSISELLKDDLYRISQNDAGAAAALQTALDKVNDTLQKDALHGVLTDQDRIIDLVNQEYSRLIQKKKSVDDAYYGLERASLLNDSYRKKYVEYTKILVAFVITMVLILAIYQFKDSILTFIPSFLIDFLVFVICTLSLFYCYFVYVGIRNRDSVYFDELGQDDPNLLSPSQFQANQAAANAALESGNQFNLFASGLDCVGPDCCADGTYFDFSNGKARCLPGVAPTTSPSPTTSITTSPCQAAAAANIGGKLGANYGGGINTNNITYYTD